MASGDPPAGSYMSPDTGLLEPMCFNGQRPAVSPNYQLHIVDDNPYDLGPLPGTYNFRFGELPDVLSGRLAAAVDDSILNIFLGGKQEMSRRLVRVVIYDPDEQVPSEDALVYLGEPFLTDEGDEEIFLAMDFVGLLEAHNAKRAAWRSLKDADDPPRRPPIRIGDLVRRVIVL